MPLAAAIALAGLVSAPLAAGLTPASVPTPPVAAAHGAECHDAESSARVRAGSGSEEPNDVSLAETRAARQELSERLAALAPRSRSRGEGREPTVTVDVHAHVITGADGVTGAVDASAIEEQIAVFNAVFSEGTLGENSADDFTFVLSSTDYTANDDWYNWSSDDDEVEAKTALTRGGADDLNLYLPDLGPDLLGYATYPWEAPSATDGVVLDSGTLPGGDQALYNLGDTAVHEVGHWLGLFHTFENGCEEPGDGVDDTPFQADGDNVTSCDESLDTCTQPGSDPVHNYMSYGNDICIDHFTAGQRAIMADSWRAFREPSVQPQP